MKKTLTTLDVLNIIAWNNSLTQEKLNAIPLKIRFALKKAIGHMMPDVKQFEEFRDEELKKIQSGYIDNGKTEEVVETIKDKDGNPILDENGAERTQSVQKIKDEYTSEYQGRINELNKKLGEIVMEKTTYEYNGANIVEMVENLPDDTPLAFEDIDMLDALLSEE